MKTIKQLSTLGLGIIFLALFSLSSCKKNREDNGGNSNGIKFDNSAKVNATLLGHVLDENGNPVDNATVKIGNMVKNTNSEGIYYFRNINTSASATVITVEKAGYFKQIKTVMCTKDQDVYTRIRLTPRTLTGSFAAGVGGEITTNGNAKVSFPNNAIMVDASKATYQGTVNVYAKWIDPRGANISEIMPSDLRGVATNGDEKVLHSYGMMVVELEDASGNKLQIRDGKMATLTMPIPSAETGSAPGSIPLWFVDETNGMWTEQGSAKKVGSNYIGEVSHFTYWNVDIPRNFVQFKVILVDQFNNPIPNCYINIREEFGSNHSDGFTNSEGLFVDFLSENTNFIVEFYKSSCGNKSLILTEKFNSEKIEINLGLKILAIPLNETAVVSGKLLDCNNLPISNGFISINEITSGFPILIQPKNNGEFSISLNLCSGLSSYNIFAFNSISNEYNNYTYQINTGNNNIGNIQACGNSNDFINFSIDDYTTIKNYSFSTPSNTIAFNYNGTYTIISGSDNLNNSATIMFQGLKYSLAPQQFFDFDYYDGTSHFLSNTSADPVFVNLNYYGNINQSILGSFTDTFMDNNNEVILNCTFKSTVQ